MSERLGRAWSAVRRPSAGVAALLLLAGANATLVRATNCSTNSHLALVRSIDRHGELSIDRYQWQTCDKSYDRGHFYTNKAPGLAFVVVPAYGVLALAGLAGEHPPSVQDFRASYDDLRAVQWPLSFVGALLPVLLLLLLVRRLGEEVAPGYGTAAAMSLGAASLVLPFSSVLYQHALSATLAFVAFALLWIERREPERLLVVAAAAAIAAYAASVEYPVGLVGVVLFVYAVSRAGPRLRRAAAYAGGGLLGILPLLLYNRFAFGSFTQLSYANQVRSQGQSGHDVLGAQTSGLYGVTSPRLHQGLFLLFGHKGLLILGPVMALGAVGIVLLYRRGYRAEALVCAIVPSGFLGYNSGFPIGGDVPGPRYLVPMLPFLAVPLALVWRRLPVTTLVLSAGSAVLMVGATVTAASWGGSAIWPWFDAAAHGDLQHTLLTPLGLGHGWIALLPFLLLLAAAIALAVRATPRVPVWRRDVELACGATAGWLLLAGVSPILLERGGTGVEVAVVLLVAAVAALVWAVAVQGPWALAAALPLLIAFSPSLAKRSAAVVAAAAATLAIIALAELVRRSRQQTASRTS